MYGLSPKEEPEREIIQPLKSTLMVFNGVGLRKVWMRRPISYKPWNVPETSRDPPVHRLRARLPFAANLHRCGQACEGCFVPD